MASGKEIKSRIKSIKNTGKITKAMELVSAAKMRKAVARTFEARAYATAAEALLKKIDGFREQEKPKGDKLLLIVITSNKGLCGGYNTQVLKLAAERIKQYGRDRTDIVSIGSKGKIALARLGSLLIASFTELPEMPTSRDVAPIANYIDKQYASGEYAKVELFYTHYVSALTQTPTHKVIVGDTNGVTPAEAGAQANGQKTNSLDPGSNFADSLSGTTQEKEDQTDYLIEPSQSTILPNLLRHLSKQRFYHALLESLASEHSARMVAMKNAKESAEEMIDELGLAYNKARQASITQEISEISAGMAAVS